MGFDKNYSNYIMQTHKISKLVPTLKKHFNEVIHNPKKNMGEIDNSGEGKYDFYGHTLYLDIPPSEQLHKFHELIKSDLALHDKSYDDSKSLNEDIIKSYEKIKDHELFDLLIETDKPLTIYSFLFPTIIPTNNPGYFIANNGDRMSIAFAQSQESIFHEIIESIAQYKYSKRMSSIFSNAVSNILDNGSCGTEHEFYDNGDFDPYDFDVDDKINFTEAKNLARTLKPDQLDDFVISLMEATKNTGHTSFKDADPYDILLPYRDGRLFNPSNGIPSKSLSI